MKVSIITVVFNNAGLIQSAIDSVSNQDYSDIEHLIIDGGSTDGTVEILKVNPKIKWISEKDEGLYDAMNKGVKMASGEIVGLLNSDDIFKSDDVVSSVVGKFDTDPSMDVLFGNLEYVKREDTSQKVRTWVTGKYFTDFFEQGLVPPHPTVYLRKKVYEKHLFNLSYKLASDYEFMLRVFKDPSYEIGYLDKVMISMRLGGVTNNSFKNIWDGNIEIRNAWRANGFQIPTLFWVKRILFKLKQFFK